MTTAAAMLDQRPRPARLGVGVVVGTRSEAVTLAPVVWALAASPFLSPVVVSTGLQDEPLDPVLASLGMVPDHVVSNAGTGAGRPQPTDRLVRQLRTLLAGDGGLGALVVQGHSTNAVCAALAAFSASIPVAHVEAGLPAADVAGPFPDERNRRTIAVATRWHFAPTEWVARRLRAEGAGDHDVTVTGSTVTETLSWARRSRLGRSAFSSRRTRILVTLDQLDHKETQGSRMRGLGEAIARVTALAGSETVVPLRTDAIVRQDLVPSLSVPSLSAAPGVRLVEPLGYFDVLATLEEADLLLTHSSGVREEASSMGIPTLVCQESVETPERVVTDAVALLAAPVRRSPMAPGPCRVGPRTVGTGDAGRRIVDRLAADLARPRSAGRAWRPT